MQFIQSACSACLQPAAGAVPLTPPCAKNKQARRPAPPARHFGALCWPEYANPHSPVVRLAY